MQIYIYSVLLHDYSKMSLYYSEPIADVSWHITSDSQFILAVAFNHKVSIFGQKRATHLEDDNVWILYSDIEMDM